MITHILGYMPYIINSFNHKNRRLKLHINIKEIKVLIQLHNIEKLEDGEKSVRTACCH